jgi:L-ascorbate metabolism protein UlaG (beta-lactamase superfamily)
LFGDRVRVVREGDEILEGGTRVRALPAEGPPRAVGFHPRGEGVSYLVDFEDARYLFLGDSVALPEHVGLAPDVAFFAVGGLAVMDPSEAAAAAAAVRPAHAVPIHWGDLNGRFDLAVRFARECETLGVRAAADTQLASVDQSAHRARSDGC